MPGALLAMIDLAVDKPSRGIPFLNSECIQQGMDQSASCLLE
jgi:hypothetical protein